MGLDFIPGFAIHPFPVAGCPRTRRHICVKIDRRPAAVDVPAARHRQRGSVVHRIPVGTRPSTARPDGCRGDRQADGQCGGVARSVRFLRDC